MTTIAPGSTTDSSPAPFRWLRVGNERVRPARQVDCTVPAELAAGSGRVTARWPREAIPGQTAPDRWRSASRLRLLECDCRIVAGVALETGEPAVEPGPHPWSRLTAPGSPLLAPADPAPTLVVTGLVYRPPNTGLPPRWLRSTIVRACQRAGAREAIAFVSIDPPTDGADWSPEAYLQQVYFGAVDDPEVAPFLAADFVPRGIASPEDFPFDEWRALLVWENARR